MSQGAQTPPPGPIWISAAETSADLHGAELIRALRELHPDISFLGIGGETMRGEGLEAIARAEDLSAMGISEVLGLVPRVLAIHRRIKQILHSRPPSCLILIDAPDFHFRVAKMASRMGIPVFYYISPQVWAWRKRRIRFIQKHIRHMLCILPFEQDFYARHGVQADFVGHPLLQHLDKHIQTEPEVQGGRIALLPGSRRMEIQRLLPEFAQAARLLQQRFPGLKFHLVQAQGISRQELTKGWPEEVPLRICPFRERYELIQSSSLALTASGTASLECALLGTPALVAYKLSPLSYAVAKLAVDVPFISLPNLILDREVFPEFIQSRARGDNLAERAAEWLQDPAELSRLREELAALRAMLGSNAARQSARIVWSGINAGKQEGIDRGSEQS